MIEIKSVDELMQGKLVIGLSTGESFVVTLLAWTEEQLYEGDTITEQRIQKLASDFFVKEFIDRGEHFLSYRMRSRAELENYFKQRFEQKYRKKTTITIDVAELICQSVERFCEQGLIDDTEFARQFVISRVEAYPRPIWVIAGELQRKGVTREVVTAVLDELEVTNTELADRALKKRFGGNIKGGNVEKAKNYLKGKGFGWDIISELIQENGNM